MACVDSLEKLSLVDVTDQSMIRPLLQETPLKEKILAAKIDGVHTDFVIAEFLDRIFVVITQRQTFSNIFAVSKDTPKAFEENLDFIYTVRSILGADTEQSGELAARFLYEHTYMNKPAVFALGLKDQSPRAVRAFRDIINKHKSW